MTITVHHLNNSRSQRVLWLLEELGLPYEIKFYERDKATMLAPPELSAVHPLGKSPVVSDGDLVVAESGAILEYLVDRYGQGRLKPAGDTPEALLRYRYWMHYAEGSVMPPLLMKLIFDRIERGPMPFFVKPIAKGIAAKVKGGFIQPSIDRHFNFIEAELGKGAWFAGDAFTAADVQMSFPLEAAAARGGPAAKQPRVTDFLKRIHARPAYQRALARGGPYALMS
ncbi:glutathione S-transferase [soil metagenome]